MRAQTSVRSNQPIISLANALLPVLAASVYGVIGEKFYHILAILPSIGLILAFGLRAPESHLKRLLKTRSDGIDSLLPCHRRRAEPMDIVLHTQQEVAKDERWW